MQHEHRTVLLDRLVNISRSNILVTSLELDQVLAGESFWGARRVTISRRNTFWHFAPPRALEFQV